MEILRLFSIAAIVAVLCFVLASVGVLGFWYTGSAVAAFLGYFIIGCIVGALFIN